MIIMIYFFWTIWVQWYLSYCIIE